MRAAKILRIFSVYLDSVGGDVLIASVLVGNGENVTVHVKAGIRRVVSVIMLLLTPYVPFTLVVMFVLWVYGVYITSHAIDSYKSKNNIR